MKDLVKVIQVSKTYLDRNQNPYKEIIFETYFEEEPKYKTTKLVSKANFWKDSGNPMIAGDVFEARVGDIWLGKIVSKNYYLKKKLTDKIVTMTLPILGDTEDEANFRACTDAMFSRVKDLQVKVDPQVAKILNEHLEDLGAKKPKNLPQSPPFPLLGGIFKDDEED